MRIRAIWVLRLWLAAELVTAFESVRHPANGLEPSLFAIGAMLGAALAAGWLARHGRDLLARCSTQLRADRLSGISILSWVLALIDFALPARLDLTDIGEGLAIVAFALSSAWAIKHRPRWIIAGLTAITVTNLFSSRTGSTERASGL